MKYITDQRKQNIENVYEGSKILLPFEMVKIKKKTQIDNLLKRIS